MKSKTILFIFALAIPMAIHAQSYQSQLAGDVQSASINSDLEVTLVTGYNSLAVFPGGTKAFKAYLKKEFTYQDLARENGFEGTIIVRCTIDVQGLPKNVSIIQSVHPLIDAKALAVIQNMPAWRPAMVNGIPKSTVIDIPFQLRLR